MNEDAGVLTMRLRASRDSNADLWTRAVRSGSIPSRDAIDVDASEALIASAQAIDPGGHYRSLAYDRLSALAAAAEGPFDVATCNFSLLDDALSTTLRAIGKLLADKGRLHIQTLHPWTSTGAQPYRDGWREERFAGFTSGRWRPMPWYFRTLGSWLREIETAGLTLVAIDEPLHERTLQTLSLLLTCANKVDRQQ